MSTTLTAEKKSPGSSSLADFYATEKEVTLDNCDREPIHLIGGIQDHGALFILERETQRIVSMSDNISRLFGFESEEELADVKYLRDVFSELSEVFEDAPVNRKIAKHVPLEYVNDIEGNTYNAIHHYQQGYDFIELWKEKPLTASRLRNVLQVFHQQNSEILRASTFEKAISCAFSAVRDLTKCERVLIYKFLPDWSGKVIAEDRDDHMPGFLEHRFPATDIPKQARHLMQILPYRATISVHDEVSVLANHAGHEIEPFDLTWCLLRATSKMHTAYLRHMGVEASFVVPLLLEGRLWGAMACNFTKPKMLPFDVMNFVHDFGNSLMNRADQDERTIYLASLNEVKDIEREIVAEALQQGEFNTSLEKYAPQLMELIKADGFAFIYGDEYVLSGTVPSLEFIQQLAEWSSKQEWEEGYYATESLHKLWPEAKGHMDTACGVLIDNVRQNGRSCAIWFRIPVVQTIIWAGNPDEKYGPQQPGGPDVLTPRNSFETWKTEHDDKSEFWERDQIMASREVVKNLLSVVSPPIGNAFDQ